MSPPIVARVTKGIGKGSVATLTTQKGNNLIKVVDFGIIYFERD
jgi:hypothetical protein